MTDFRPERDDEHPVRWTPASGTEPDRWLSLEDAKARLGLGAVELEVHGRARTPFAHYEVTDA